MNIVVDVPESLVGRMRTVIENGEYDDPGEFLRVALENQIELEESEGRDAVTLQEALESVDSDSGSSSPSRRVEEGSHAASSSEPSDESLRGSSGSRDVSTSRRGYDGLPTVAPPADSRLDAGPLWGQYNRIFPVKLVVRGLANELRESVDVGASTGPWLKLPDFRRRIARVAREVGTDVAAADSELGRRRGEKLSTGLPTGEDAEKSLERFRTHFVGRLESGDELTGAPPHLLFVDIGSGSPQTIGLTEAGREFASLSNPILDEGADAERSLSPDERRFYLDHVREARPAEFTAMQKVAQAIDEGDDRPTSLTERVAFLDPEWSNSQADTIRSGLTSRMYELGLLDRTRVGQRGVAYELTDDGIEFFEDDAASGDTDQTEDDD